MDNQKHECHLDIRQIPQFDNRQAVVLATIHDQTGVWQGIGASVCVNIGEAYSPQTLIDEASKQAQERALANSVTGKANKEVEAKPKLVDTPVRPEKGRVKSSRPHRSEPGTITDKQFTTLTKMSHERHTTLDALAQEQFGTSPSDLSSEQAQLLFDHFKSQGR